MSHHDTVQTQLGPLPLGTIDEQTLTDAERQTLVRLLDHSAQELAGDIASDELGEILGTARTD